MRTGVSSGKGRHVRRFGMCLIVLALVAGLAGCAGFRATVEYTLTISSTEGGTVTAPGEGSFTYEERTSVPLLAEPEEGYQFLYWTGKVGWLQVTAASTSIGMYDNYSLVANFAPLFAGGSGTPADPFQIANWRHLDNVRIYSDGCFVLMNDLHRATPGYSALAGPGANEGKGWQPIGTAVVWEPLEPDHPGSYESVDPFTGVFDGQGYKIRDLFIERPDEDGVGLFGTIGVGGMVEDVLIVNAAVTGQYLVGGLVGATDHGVSINGSHSAGDVVGRGGVGGVVGLNTGTVENSYSTASTSGSEFVGGLVGANLGTVSKSYSSGSVTGDGGVGGLVGRNMGDVDNSYSIGSVTCVSTFGAAGGLVGLNEGAVWYAYSAGTVTETYHAGGLVGFGGGGDVGGSYWDAEASGFWDSEGGWGATTEEMMDIHIYISEDWDITAVGFGETDDAYIWNIVDGQTYPFLSWQSV